MVSLKTILLKILLNNQTILIQTKLGDHKIVFSKQVEGYFSLDIEKIWEPSNGETGIKLKIAKEILMLVK